MMRNRNQINKFFLSMQNINKYVINVGISHKVSFVFPPLPKNVVKNT